jgi:cell division protein FtsB
VLKTLKNLWRPQRIKEHTDIRNVGFYIFAVVVLAIAWSGVKTIQNNYELQKQISVLKQQNEVLRLSNRNTELQSQFYETDQYLELSARQNLGLAAPGETVWIVPKAVALKYIDQSLNVHNHGLSEGAEAATASGFRKNFQDWRNFVLGREVQNNL